MGLLERDCRIALRTFSASRAKSCSLLRASCPCALAARASLEKAASAKLLRRGCDLREPAFLNTENGLAGCAIENEKQALLRHLRDGGNIHAIFFYRDERGRRVEVEIKNVVMLRLEIPLQFSRFRIEGDDAAGIEIQAMPRATISLVSRIADGTKHEAALRIDRDWRPKARP